MSSACAIRDTRAGTGYPAPLATVPQLSGIDAAYPDYAEFFGTDGAYSSYGLAVSGQWQTAMNQLSTMRTVSQIVNGSTGKVVGGPCYPDPTHGSITGMKVSVSLPEDDVEFLDSYAHDQGLESRSAALHKAVGLLRTAQLTGAYEDAWKSWTASEDAEAWESVTADGLGT
ncbi:MAG TPA: ribbon-helix-helix domain-containing protein [Streptosporangiaceae bacterium]|nr:ribbon-helix-helix domain-containing protein [Streptosporangiaceae bacterium]